MKITINGQPHLIALTQNQSSAPLEQVINLLAQAQQPEIISDSFVLALNSTFVPRSSYPSTHINNGDEIEILSPMVGG